MRIHLLRLSTLLLAISLPLVGCGKAIGGAHLPDDPQSESVGAEPPPNSGGTVQTVPDAPSAPTPLNVRVQTLAKYQYLDPNHIVPQKLLETAVLYFDSHLSSIANQNYLSVIDYSLRSTKARFFIIDMKSGSVWAIHTAHGKGSDPDGNGYATLFSNVSGSEQSSLGMMMAAETYNGKHGLSLRLDGLSSTNSNVRARAIVIHQADYVQESEVVQGRSWGCPAVANSDRDELIKRLKGGSLIYAGLSAQN